jgi:ribonuclease HII
MPGSLNIAQLTLSQIREILHHGEGIEPGLLDQLRRDPRRGARKLGHSLRRLREKRDRAEARLRELTLPERGLRRQGARIIAGLDEAGRGPLAGPVVSAAVILPWPCNWLGLDDSKRLTPRRRQMYTQHIMINARAVGLGIVSPARIDAVGILQATWESMCRALVRLSLRPDHLLVDGPLPIPGISILQTPLINGDARSLSVAAASVVAKVNRDRIMCVLDRKYPQYGFARHKGYGTAQHLVALRRYGPCSAHRRSFRGVEEGR